MSDDDAPHDAPSEPPRLKDEPARIRPQIPLDLESLRQSTSRAQRVVRIQRWVRLGFIALIGVGAVLWYLDAREREQTPPAQRPAIERVDPEVLRRSTGAGARVRPMLGQTESMMVVVRTVPPGALLTVDGKERGETPAGLDTRCDKGTPVTLEVHAEGYRRWRRQVPCQPGLELTFEPVLTPLR